MQTLQEYKCPCCGGAISTYQPQPSAGASKLLQTVFFFAKNISRSYEIILRTLSLCAIIQSV